jgi:polysaccharide deacetylase 2 family uncharacterized protein YibQ
MPFDPLIRRSLSFVRRYGWDGAFALLLVAALALAGAPAWSGWARLVQSLSPIVQAQASSGPVVAGADHARLAVAGMAGARHYSPQVLFPVPAHNFPDWLRGSKVEAVPPAARPTHPAVIAICIDDLGEDIAGTDKAMALPQQVALSFLPYAETTPFLAAEAARKGHEILAHVPMEAIGPVDPGPMALKVGAPDIAARLAWNIGRVPGLAGINNHEGSKFSSDEVSLLPVVRTLASRHLFFFDTRTGPDTKIVTVAHRFGVASAGRDIFLDDTVSDAAIRQQLAALVTVARTQGIAIAIGHPHDVTLKVLAAWLAQDQSVTLVPLSQAIALKSQLQRVAAR